jgi:ABC-type sugar transport system ATPase subunit
MDVGPVQPFGVVKIIIGQRGRFGRARRLADEGAAIVMISSDMDEIVAESDRVAVMHEGRITGILDRAACTPESIMQLAVA